MPVLERGTRFYTKTQVYLFRKVRSIVTSMGVYVSTHDSPVEQSLCARVWDQRAQPVYLCKICSKHLLTLDQRLLDASMHEHNQLSLTRCVTFEIDYQSIDHKSRSSTHPSRVWDSTNNRASLPKHWSTYGPEENRV